MAISRKKQELILIWSFAHSLDEFEYDTESSIKEFVKTYFPEIYKEKKVEDLEYLGDVIKMLLDNASFDEINLNVKDAKGHDLYDTVHFNINGWDHNGWIVESFMNVKDLKLEFYAGGEFLNDTKDITRDGYEKAVEMAHEILDREDENKRVEKECNKNGKIFVKGFFRNRKKWIEPRCRTHKMGKSGRHVLVFKNKKGEMKVQYRYLKHKSGLNEFSVELEFGDKIWKELLMLKCQECGEEISYSENMEGERRVKCPKCKETYEIDWSDLNIHYIIGETFKDFVGMNLNAFYDKMLGKRFGHWHIDSYFEGGWFWKQQAEYGCFFKDLTYFIPDSIDETDFMPSEGAKKIHVGDWVFIASHDQPAYILGFRGSRKRLSDGYVRERVSVLVLDDEESEMYRLIDYDNSDIRNLLDDDTDIVKRLTASYDYYSKKWDGGVRWYAGVKWLDKKVSLEQYMRYYTLRDKIKALWEKGLEEKQIMRKLKLVEL